MPAKQLLCLNNKRISDEGAFKPPVGLGSCPFKGSGSVVDDSLFIVAPILCVVVFVWSCFVTQHFMSF